MLVSIITPTYNSSGFLRETFESIINQSYTNWELIVTDDCSSDNTWQLLKEFAEKDSRISVFRLNNNLGPGYARNHSIAKAKGKYLAFCDSDDLWNVNKLEKQISFMSMNNLLLTYSDYDEISESSGLIRSVISPSNLTYKRMINNDYVGFLTLIYNCEKIGKIFMPEMRRRQDYAYKLILFKHVKVASKTPGNLAQYRVRRNSISSNKFKLLKYNYKIYSDIEGFNTFKATYFMIRFIIFYFLKKIK